MSATAPEPTLPEAEAIADPHPPRGGVVAVIGLYMAATLTYALLGRSHVVPLLFPDELVYSHLSRSLADGDGLTWRGAPASLPSTLYVYLLAPAWKLGTTTAGYAAAKVIGVLLLSTIVFPVFFLAREVVGSRIAWATALLSVAGTWMVTSALVLAENVALPLSTASLAATVMMLRRPGSRWPWIALVCAIAAALARIQLVVLVPVILAAVLADCARSGEDWRDRARAHRQILAVLGALLVAGLIAAAIDAQGLVGRYESITGFSPSGDELFTSAGRQWTALVAAAGFAPIITMLTVIFSRAAWRDGECGALLAVGVPATLAFVVQSGWFLAGAGLTVMVERYVAYVVPLACVLMVVVATRRELFWPPGLLVAGGAVLLLLASDQSLKPIEERAISSVTTRLDWLGLSTPAALAVVGILAFALVAGILYLRAEDRLSASVAAYSLVAFSLLVFVVQSATAWNWEIDEARRERALMPGDLRWVDKAGDPPVSRLAVTGYNPQFHHVEFFNRDISNSFAPQGARLLGLDYGKTCGLSISPGGKLQFEKSCGPVGRRFLVDDLGVRLTFYDQTIEARRRNHGRVVRTGTPPRLLAGVGLPCDDPVIAADDPTPLCRGPLQVSSFLDKPATIRVAFRGGETEQAVEVSGKQRRLPPRRMTTFDIPVAKGDQVTTVPVSWKAPGGAPTLVKVDLVRDGQAASLL